MSVLVPSIFKNCAPAEELLEYPIWLPPPNYRGRPAPVEETPETLEGGVGSGLLGPDGEPLEGGVGSGQLQEPEAPPEPEEPPLPPVNKQKEKFAELVGDPEAKVEVTKIAEVARKVGLAPSQEDLKALHEEFGEEVDFETYQIWAEKRLAKHKEEDKPEKLVTIFQEVDPSGAGVVSRQQLAVLLGNYGEAMTKEEIDGILEEFDMKGDKIDYKLFLEKLLAEPEEE